jgi:murein DD-endopeptidase MepM/ murein hydrolase activator NlpD
MRRAAFGDPAESAYQLPFPEGTTSELFQSYCFAAGTHNDELSYDFLLPIGTDIVAARSGTVADLYDGSPDDGTGQANYLIVEHDDGTAALYGHLQQRGILVGLGDT